MALDVDEAGCDDHPARIYATRSFGISQKASGSDSRYTIASDADVTMKPGAAGTIDDHAIGND